MKSIKTPISRGFNLVEIAIVLVIFTLVITGILRGQELINSAKARNLIDQKSSFQTAFIAFSNRYKLTAGDLTATQASYVANNIVLPSGVTCAGDGVINFDANATCANNPESVLVFQNLTAVNLLSCANCMNVLSSAPNVDATTGNTYINSYSQSYRFGLVSASNAAAGGYWLDPNPTLMPAKNVLSTGSKITAAILQQVDQKADDGLPHSGLFRQSTTDSADSTIATSTTSGCTTVTGAGSTAVYAWATNSNANCAGAWLF
jgi:prepilin-type N-terminal cleavage/methylation domain-containing protein